jgi:hypothetical protein
MDGSVLGNAGATPRMGWSRPYVSDRQSHSIGPYRKRASHHALNTIWAGKITSASMRPKRGPATPTSPPP